MRSLFLVALVVPDYDAAIAWYRDVLDFALVADTDLGEGKRWVVVRPGKASGAGLLLAKADGEGQAKAIGNQTGGRVGFFLETDDFARDHALYRSRGVEFTEEPRYEAYGTVAVFRDAFGNLWDLIEHRKQPLPRIEGELPSLRSPLDPPSAPVHKPPRQQHGPLALGPSTSPEKCEAFAP